ncbi:hypothetical protein SOVF_126950 [Spinacia oleracea]|uniref:Trihelix transcription factor ASIL2 n=1 Tax=Spinacia oleracea TaxID=3562 RepID=A0A9R0JNG4_SPIOL|nr:trihelix transcription factor ASIL2-like [Spinacia oleracea]KNA12325.1 hypothetical protein SOVF_126950 [Spinacia oleracea]
MPSPPPGDGDVPQPPGNPPLPVVRKFPAPCWTQDETLALIHAYQDKWYSLRRRNLRTADWEAVADEVNRRCPDQSPPKTSAQCRHKMEKLRKRYRAEKQRIGALPCHNNFVGNRFFPSSSWVFFDLMDAMEIGPGPGSGSTTIINNGINSNNNNVNLQNLSKDNLQNHLQNGVFVKEEKNRGKDDLGKYFDEILMGMGKGGSGSGGGAPIKFKVKNHQNNINNHDRYFDDPNQNKYEGYDYDGGNNGRSNYASGFTNKRRFGEDLSSSKMAFLNNGGSSSSKKGLGSGSGMGPGPGSRVRGRDPGAGEMVASIKMLGEALVRTEKEKLEMMQEMEMKWMEMEMKRTQMILEAQHNIVNAFVQGFKKQKKVKVMEVE